MQITLTMPDEYLASVDATAKAMGLSRSAFIRLRISGLTADAALKPGAPAALGAHSAEDILDKMGFKRHEGPTQIYYREQDLPALQRLLATASAPAARATHGSAEAAPSGYVLVTIEEQDLGKEAWMSPSDAGL